LFWKRTFGSDENVYEREPDKGVPIREEEVNSTKEGKGKERGGSEKVKESCTYRKLRVLLQPRRT